jgi:hypothetical protein
LRGLFRILAWQACGFKENLAIPQKKKKFNLFVPKQPLVIYIYYSILFKFFFLANTQMAYLIGHKENRNIIFRNAEIFSTKFLKKKKKFSKNKILCEKKFEEYF